MTYVIDYFLNLHIRTAINKKVGPANKSRTLLPYTITYHYDLISLSSSDAKQKIVVFVADRTRLSY